MSAQLGCLKPSSPLASSTSSSMTATTSREKGMVSNKRSFKKTQEQQSNKEMEAEKEVTNSLNRMETISDPSTVFFMDHHYIRGKTLTFLLPSSSFLLFRTPPYDCYGPGWGLKIEEAICQAIEEKVTKQIALYFYSHLTGLAKNFGWKSNHYQRKPCRTFYQCQWDKSLSEEEVEKIGQDVQHPLKACYVTLITWAEEEQWRCKLVNLRVFHSILEGQKFYLERMSTHLQRQQEETMTTSDNVKKWTIVGGDL